MVDQLREQMLSINERNRGLKQQIDVCRRSKENMQKEIEMLKLKQSILLKEKQLEEEQRRAFFGKKAASLYSLKTET
jgi:hypothetical protein